MKNAINFFELPASNHQRAVYFYENLLGQVLQRDEIQGVKMAFFKSDEKTAGGAICTGKGYTPGQRGVVFFLNGGKDMDDILKKVKDLGGRIVQPRQLISADSGYIACFIDSEGNKVGVHSRN